MRRKILLGSGALALAVSATVASGAGVAGAVKVPTTMSGAISCTTTGVVKFSTALTSAGGAPSGASLRVSFAGCHGTGATSGAVTLTKGSLQVTTSSTFPSACGPIFTTGVALPSFTGTVIWKGTGGKIASSAVTIFNSDFYYNQGANTLTQYFTTVSFTSGSYAGETVHLGSLQATKSAISTTATCAGAGVKAIGFGAPGGTVSVGA